MTKQELNKEIIKKINILNTRFDNLDFHQILNMLKINNLKVETSEETLQRMNE